MQTLTHLTARTQCNTWPSSFRQGREQVVVVCTLYSQLYLVGYEFVTENEREGVSACLRGDLNATWIMHSLYRRCVHRFHSDLIIPRDVNSALYVYSLCLQYWLVPHVYFTYTWWLFHMHTLWTTFYRSKEFSLITNQRAIFTTISYQTNEWKRKYGWITFACSSHISLGPTDRARVINLAWNAGTWKAASIGHGSDGWIRPVQQLGTQLMIETSWYQQIAMETHMEWTGDTTKLTLTSLICNAFCCHFFF